MSVYNVYLVITAGAPRDHHAIFIETNADLSGHTFQVTGNIQSGMTHEDKKATQPEENPAYQSKKFLGTIDAARYDEVKAICESVPAPGKQFEGPRRLYPQTPLRRCHEWTKEAIDALVEANVLQRSTDHPGT